MLSGLVLSMPDIVTLAPSPVRASRASIEAFALTVGEKLNFTIRQDMNTLARRLGGHVVHGRYDDEPRRLSPTGLTVEPSGLFVIETTPNGFSPEEVFYIDAVQALGHLFLHWPVICNSHPGARMVAPRLPGDEATDEVRHAWREAYWFGTALAMPEAVLRKEAPIKSERLFALQLGVPLRSLRIRYKHLGLEDPSEAILRQGREARAPTV